MNLLAQFSDELEALVARAMPAVVGVEHGRGHGTGLVLAPDGYVLTNSHVVRGARRLDVQLAGGDTLRGELVGQDPSTDLAVVRVDRRDLPMLPLAAPESIKVGQVVVAIGNPFHLEGSVSLGVVSAVDRTLGFGGGNQFEGLLQTDAAINPGNSGGPLLNVRGEVVGINTIMLPRAQGIGFAVPASTARWIAALLIRDGSVQRRYVGVGAKAEVLATSLAKELGQRKGVRVLEVGSDTPASRAGLKRGDLVIGAQGEQIGSVDDLQRLLALAKAPEVRLAVWREGARRELDVRTEAPRRAA